MIGSEATMMAPNLSLNVLISVIISSVGLVVDTEINDNCESLRECSVLGEKAVRIKVNESMMSDSLFVFCHSGWEKEWYRLWLNPRIKLVESEHNQGFKIINGGNVTDVKDKHAESSLFNLLGWYRFKEEYSFSPFNNSCIGIVSDKVYDVDFKVKNPELWYLASVVTGIVIFFLAKSWSRNISLHYGTGISMGILASLLIAVFILQRLMPQKLKTFGYVLLAVSGSASMFILQKVGNSVQDILQNHWQVALGYVVVSGFISFCVVYRYGPITDTRTLNLVRWTLQVFGMLFIYFGSQIPEASIAIIIVVLSVYNFPTRLITGLRSLRYRFFRPKYRLLTEDEYMQEGHLETQKALAELRSFCQSPDCHSWRIISRIREPSRFAKFVEGDSHISDSELLEHDSIGEFRPPLDLSDDESETDFQLSTL